MMLSPAQAAWKFSLYTHTQLEGIAKAAAWLCEVRELVAHRVPRLYPTRAYLLAQQELEATWSQAWVDLEQALQSGQDSCSGCRGASVHHTCGLDPQAIRPGLQVLDEDDGFE